MAEAYRAACPNANNIMPITYYISELKNQLELLHQDSCPDPLEHQERLFHLLESLQAERELLPSVHDPLLPAGGKNRHPAENDAQGKTPFPLESEAELCLLELEAHAELPFSTPDLRRRLMDLLGQAQALLHRLPASESTLRHRLAAALSLHLPAA